MDLKFETELLGRPTKIAVAIGSQVWRYPIRPCVTAAANHPMATAHLGGDRLNPLVQNFRLVARLASGDPAAAHARQLKVASETEAAHDFDGRQATTLS